MHWLLAYHRDLMPRGIELSFHAVFSESDMLLIEWADVSSFVVSETK